MKKFILWSAISTLWIFFPGQPTIVKAQEEEPQGPCQRLIEQAWRYGTTTTNDISIDELASSQALLREQVIAICLLNGEQPRTDEGAISTDQTPSPENFSVPSLWWPQQQLGDAINERLVDSWRAYANSANNLNNATPEIDVPHVDVVINGQLWPSLNYLERYSLMSQFGQSAQDYDYQLRVFTGNRPVGLQVCDFHGDIVSPIPLEDPTKPGEIILKPVCAIVLNYFDQGAIRGGRQR
jgi:hypothetical protein